MQEPASGQRQQVSFAPSVCTSGSNRCVVPESSTRRFTIDAPRQCGRTRVLPSDRSMKPAGDEHQDVAAALAIGESASGGASESFLLVVADGMGGHPAGDVASQMAMNTLI